MSNNNQKKEVGQEYPQKVASPQMTNKEVTALNVKKRSYEDLQENRDLKSVLCFVPRIVQINERKKNQQKNEKSTITKV